jgi:uncharacterized delta-60 repeat protein
LAISRAALAAPLAALLSISAAAYAAPTDLDHGFSNDGSKTFHSDAHSELMDGLVVLPSGKTVVLTQTLDQPALELRRLRENGSADPTFGGGDGLRGFAPADNYEDLHLAVDPRTGKIYVSTFLDSAPFTTTIWRIRANGSMDTAYGGGDGHAEFTGRIAESLLALPGGRLLMAGEDLAALDADVWALNDKGRRDRSFGHDGTARLSSLKTADATSLARRRDGAIMVAGSDYDPTATMISAYRLTENGHLDHSFSDDGKALIDPSQTDVTTSTAWSPQVLVRPDNRTVYVAGLNQDGGVFQNTLFLAGLTPNGHPDHRFGTHLYDDLTETSGQSVLQRDGKLLVSGHLPPNPSTTNAVYRFTRRGRPDGSWDATGMVTLEGASELVPLGITPKGRVLVGRTVGAGPYDAQILAFRGTRTPSCHGRLATQFGSSKGNEITGTSGKDVLVGLGGNDVVKGLGGNDVLCGNAGNDTLVGGPGTDLLFGGAGTNVLKP